MLGFFNAYRKGTRITRRVLTGIADPFQYWLKNRSEKWGAPVVEAPEEKRCALDRLYQRICDDLDELFRAGD